MAPSLGERFWSRVDKRGPDECWPWTAFCCPLGYGKINVGRPHRLATHVAIFLSAGEWPRAGMCVCHTCDNPGCVNPAHLWLGTHADNMRDKTKKGRAAKMDGENNPRAKLTAEAVQEIRKLRGQVPQSRLAARFGVGQPTISMVQSRARWRQ